MENLVKLSVDCGGVWEQKLNSWEWISPSRETIVILVRKVITYKELLSEVIENCISGDVENVSLTYVCNHLEKLAPSRIKNDKDVAVFMYGGNIPTLRVSFNRISDDRNGMEDMGGDLQVDRVGDVAYDRVCDVSDGMGGDDMADGMGGGDVADERVGEMADDIVGDVTTTEDGDMTIAEFMASGNGKRRKVVFTDNGGSNSDAVSDDEVAVNETGGLELGIIWNGLSIDDAIMEEDEAEVGFIRNFENWAEHTGEETEDGVADAFPPTKETLRPDNSGYERWDSFKDKEECELRIKYAVVKNKFMAKPGRSSSTVFSLKCIDPNCCWSIRCTKYKSTPTFIISKYNAYHSCGSRHCSKNHPQASAKVIAEFIKNEYIKEKGPSMSEVFDRLQSFGIHPSKWKCFMSRHIARNIIRGTPERGYSILDAYRYMIEERNVGSKTALEIDENGRFKYFFVAYGACIAGFATMRKVAAVDGCHLKGKYDGVMLTAIAQDSMKCIFPIAYCVVDVECDASWTYFFEQLVKFDILVDSEEYCVISDRHQSIQNGFDAVFERASQGFCMKHLGDNLVKNFHCSNFYNAYLASVKAYTEDEFNRHFEEIRNMRPDVAACLEDKIGKSRWARAYFPGCRFSVLTTNIAESANSQLGRERFFPIFAIFESINRRWGEIFFKRHSIAIRMKTDMVHPIEKIIMENRDLGDTLYAFGSTNQDWIIHGLNQEVVVNLQRKSCTCRRFDLDKIPCPHAIAAIRRVSGGDNDFGRQIYEFTSPYYSVNYYRRSYQHPWYLIPPEGDWKVPAEFLERKIFPPDVKVKRGRKQTKRMKGVLETCRRNMNKNKCSLCGGVGHKRTTCAKQNQPRV